MVQLPRSPLSVRPRVSYPEGYIVEFRVKADKKLLSYTRDLDVANIIANSLRKTVDSLSVEIYTVKFYFESIGMTDGASLEDLGTLLVSNDTTPR